MIPVRYLPLSTGDLPIADFYNSGNNYVWEPGAPISDAQPRGWRKIKKGDKPQLCPAAGWTKPVGLKRFLRRRTRLLPRSGGAFVVWLIGPFDVGVEFDARTCGIQVGICHHRTQKPVLKEFETVAKMPKDLRAYLPRELPCQ